MAHLLALPDAQGMPQRWRHIDGSALPCTGAADFDLNAGSSMQDIKQWLSWLRSDVGFDGWRFDFVKGYPGRYVMEYIEASHPKMAVGEFWDDCAYKDSKLEYNQA